MNSKIVFCSLLFLVTGLFGKSVDKVDRENETAVIAENSSQSRAIGNEIYNGLIGCAFRYDAGCFVDVAQNYLDLKKRELLAQADREVARASGDSSADPANKPSQLASTIEKLFSDLAGLFKDGFAGFFGKDEDDDELTKETKDAEEDDDEEEDKNEDDTSRDVGEKYETALSLGPSWMTNLFEEGDDRKDGDKHGENTASKPTSSNVDNHTTNQTKKKDSLKEKIMRLVRRISIYVAIVTVLNYLFKFYYAILAFKHYLIALKTFFLISIKYFYTIMNYKSHDYDVFPKYHHQHNHPYSSHREYDIGTVPAEKKWEWEDKASKLRDIKEIIGGGTIYLAD